MYYVFYWFNLSTCHDHDKKETINQSHSVEIKVKVLEKLQKLSLKMKWIQDILNES